MADEQAERRTVRTSLIERAARADLQHSPLAQQRALAGFFAALRASFPCAQHWHRVLSPFNQV
jgi:hypothetical protein